MQSHVSRAAKSAGFGRPPHGASLGLAASVQAIDRLQYRQSPSWNPIEFIASRYFGARRFAAITADHH